MFNKEETETKQQQLLIRVCIGFGFFLAVVTKNPGIFKGKKYIKTTKTIATSIIIKNQTNL